VENEELFMNSEETGDLFVDIPLECGSFLFYEEKPAENEELFMNSEEIGDLFVDIPLRWGSLSIL